MKHGQQIGIPPGTRAIRIVRETDHWVLWLYANADFSIGTYLELHPDGRCERVTVGPDDDEKRFTVRPKDGEA